MAEPSRPSNGVLTSWKEIANFFNREVRTVQLWEKEEGLPVHRHLHRRQASVYAYPEELEKWWKERGSARLDDAGIVAGASSSEDTTVAVAPVDSVADGQAHGVEKLDPGRSWHRYWLGAAAVALLLVVAIIPFHKSIPSTTRAEQAGTLITGSAAMKEFEPALGDINGDGLDDLLFTSQPRRMDLQIRLGRENTASIDLTEAVDIVVRGSGRGALGYSSSDVNGDGIRDLIVSEQFFEPYLYTGTGDVFLFWGRKQWPKALQLADANVRIRINASNDARLHSCPVFNKSSDLNADGLEDLLLVAHEYTEAGRRSAGGLFVLTGRREWPKEMEVIADADVRVVGARTGEGLGGPSCDVGDFNGDGRADLAVYAWEGTLWEMRGRRGRSYVFNGREKWPRRLDAATDFDFRVDGEHTVGASTLRLSDINGDGIDDVVFFHTTAKPNTQAGEVMAWFGKAGRRGTISENDADLRIETEWPKLNWTASVETFDVDSDGMQDILLSSPAEGKITLLYGRREWKPRGELAEFSPAVLFSGRPGTAHWRTWVSDVDRDLLPELVIWNAPDSPAASDGVGRIINVHKRLALDVRPTAEPNILFLPDGILVAAINGKSRPGIDSLDAATVRLAGALPTERIQKDYDRDGVADLQLYFETAAMRVTPETTHVVLTARTREGLPAGATDSVQVVVKSAAHRNAPATSPD